VVTKPSKEFIDASGRRKVKGNMDIELTVDAMELAGHVDQIVLFSGDGDFRYLVEAVQTSWRPRHRRIHGLLPSADGRRRIASPSGRLHRFG